jgi:hypothetical protein
MKVVLWLQVRLATAARQWWDMLPAPSVHNTADD